MPRNVTLPNGRIIEGVPDEVPTGAVFEQAWRAGLWREDVQQAYGGAPEDQGVGNQFNIGAGKFFADRLPGMDNSAPLPDSFAAQLGYAAPAVAGAFLVPGSVGAQAAYGGATAIKKDATPTDVLTGAALSGGTTLALNAAGRVATGIRQAGQRARQTIGEATGSGAFQRMEAGIQSAGGLDFLARGRQTMLNRSVAASFGQNADNISPEVLAQAAEEIGQRFDDLVPASRTFFIGPAKKVLDELDGLGPRVSAVLPEETAITGSQFKNLRAALAERARKVYGTNEALADDIMVAIEKLDESMQDALGPGSQAAYREARELWKNLRLAESISTVARDGNVTPALLSSKLAGKSGYGTSFLRDTGKVLPQTQQLFDTVRGLTRNKAIVGDSGTATRLAAMGMLGAIGGGATALATGDPEKALYGVGAALLPYLGGRATVGIGSRLGPAAPEVVGQVGGALGILMNQERPGNE